MRSVTGSAVPSGRRTLNVNSPCDGEGKRLTGSSSPTPTDAKNAIEAYASTRRGCASAQRATGGYAARKRSNARSNGSNTKLTAGVISRPSAARPRTISAARTRTLPRPRRRCGRRVAGLPRHVGGVRPRGAADHRSVGTIVNATASEARSENDTVSAWSRMSCPPALDEHQGKNTATVVSVDAVTAIATVFVPRDAASIGESPASRRWKIDSSTTMPSSTSIPPRARARRATSG